GRCAQPCRQKYKIGNGKNIYEGYIMSPKDLCTAQNIDSLIRSGVKSLKVEGRMKRPEYV
ncbi:MAG TPA: peptidase U32, partial [Clostridiaceae bacterium]|nr:peptidase U32 [Clostridiaceae bacterium]